MKQVWERLRSELVEIIEWSDATPGAPSPEGDTLAWRYAAGGDPDRSRNLVNGAQLIVREGQWALFLDEGRLADGFGPGRHTLSTANLPLLTQLLCLPSGFESPFRAEVVFVATRLFSDRKWGTRQPLLLRDPELGPLRLRGFGSYSLRVSDPAWLVRELGVASGRIALADLDNSLRSLIVSRLADLLARSGCAAIDLAGRSETLARDLRLALSEDVGQLGLELPSLLIEALTLPPEVEAALLRRSVRLAEGEPAASHPGAARPGSSGAATARAEADRPRPRQAPPPPPPPPGLARPSPQPGRAAPAAAAPPPPTAAGASVATAGEPQGTLPLPVRTTGAAAAPATGEPDAASDEREASP